MFNFEWPAAVGIEGRVMLDTPINYQPSTINQA